MDQTNAPKNTGKILLTSKLVFIVSITVIVLTTLCIWLLGLGQHRTIFENSLLSTSILSIAFFLFLLVGLYRGVKLKDNIGKITDKIQPAKITNLGDIANGGDMLHVGEGLSGFLASLVLWLVLTILISLFFWLFSTIVWAVVLIFMAMLYWIFFRALRLVFKNSNKCKGNLIMSMAYAIGYTILYNFWIYGILLISHYLIK